LLEGLEVVQLDVGEDFSVVLARKRDLGVVTPEDRKIADEPEELCPLGLQLGVPAAEDTDDLKSENCDKLKTALGHDGGLKAHMTQLLLLGKFEYTGGPIFKVVLEC